MDKLYETYFTPNIRTGRFSKAAGLTAAAVALAACSNYASKEALAAPPANDSRCTNESARAGDNLSKMIVRAVQNLGSKPSDVVPAPVLVSQEIAPKIVYPGDQVELCLNGSGNKIVRAVIVHPTPKK